MFFGVMVSCVDPYQLDTNTFEDAIVVEATITNELRQQQIKIARTFRFEESAPVVEDDADVIVTDSDGIVFEFNQANDVYVSVQPFQAVPGKQYTLKITTAAGKTYTSTPETLTAVNPMESLEASVVTNSQGVRGVQIGVNSYDPTASSKYYRYEYDETYKVIAPEWSPYILDYDPMIDDFSLLLREEETKTCYRTDESNSIIITNTNDQSEDRLSNFPVRFISDQNYIMSYRYSILVRQYIQNIESYTFYKALAAISGSGSLLSQTQPGFLEGNLIAEDESEMIIGFFDVSSVSESRIFFNYADLFPGEDLPPYLDDCEIVGFDITIVVPAPGKSPKEVLIEELGRNGLRYHSQIGSIYYMVAPPCGDCTSIATNIIPSFWE